MTRMRKQDKEGTFTLLQLAQIVETRLPGWTKACASPKANAIVLHELAFGLTGDELFLLACAIKYAANRGKIVHVVWGALGGVEPRVSTYRGETFRD